MTEMVDLVDDEDKVIGTVAKKEVTQKQLLHRSTTIIVFDKQDKFFVQKRASNKDLWPGMLAIGVGETVQAGESYEEAAERGLKEEIGTAGRLRELFYLKFRSSESNENIKVYECTISKEPEFGDKEIAEGFFVDSKQLKKILKEENFEPVSKTVMEKYWEMKNG